MTGSLVLQGLYTLDWFSAIYERETTFVTSCLLVYFPAYQAPCEKSFPQKKKKKKEKEFSLLWIKFFSFTEDVFSEGKQTFRQLPPLLSVPMKTGP